LTVTSGGTGTLLSYISGGLHNGTNSLQTATFTVIPTTTPSCPSNPFTLTVFVNPKPEITAMSTVVCSGVTFEVSPMNVRDGIVPVNSSYRWELPQVSTASLVGGQSAAGVTFISGRLTNNTNTTRTAVYSVIPTAPAPGSCQGAAFTVVVFVNPNAVINALSTTICSGASFEVSPTNSRDGIVPANTVYTWVTAGVSNNALTVTSGGTGTLLSYISGGLHNGTNSLQTATFTVIPTTTPSSEQSVHVDGVCESEA
jgi:hypothetical protein